MEELEIPITEFFGLNHYRYGEAFFGSHRGMRFRLAANPLKKLKPGEAPVDIMLLATVWPEPWSYGKSSEEERESEEFPFTQGGYEDAVRWINERYSADKHKWDEARGRTIL